MRPFASVLAGFVAVMLAIGGFASSAQAGQTTWTTRVTPGGNLSAMSPESVPGGIVVAVFCAGSQPSIVALVDGYSEKGQISANLGFASSDGEGSTAIVREAGESAFSGKLPEAVSNLLTGKSRTALVSINNALYFNLSLEGAGAAVPKALSACWKRPSKGVSSPTPAAAKPVGPLGIAPGYYVAADLPCAEAQEVFFYDGKRAGLLDPGYRYLPRPLGKITRLPDGALLLDDQDIEVRKLAGGRIWLSVQDISPPMRVCRKSELPDRWQYF